MVVLTRNAVLSRIEGVVVAIVTRTIRELPTEVSLGRRQGLPIRCVANLDNMLTVPRNRLVRRMGACNATKTAALNAAIKFALDIP